MAVLETGLGGRLDATNARAAARHRHHARLLRPHGVSGPHARGDRRGEGRHPQAGRARGGQPPGARGARGHRAPRAGSWARPCSLEGRDFAVGVPRRRRARATAGSTLALEGLSLSLRGPHQRQNAAVALACLEQLDARRRRRLRGGRARGAGRRALAGRLEEVSRHAARGARRRAQPRRRARCCSRRSTRSTRAAASTRSSACSRTRTAQPMMRGALPALRLRPPHAAGQPALARPRALPRARPVRCARTCVPTPALDEALRRRAAPGRWRRTLVLCTGSLFLVGAVRARLRAETLAQCSSESVNSRHAPPGRLENRSPRGRDAPRSTRSSSGRSTRRPSTWWRRRTAGRW